MTDQSIVLSDDLPEIVLETTSVFGGTKLALKDDLPFVDIGIEPTPAQALQLAEYLKGEPGPAGATSWNDLTEKPTIPSRTSQLENDSGFVAEDSISSDIVRQAALDEEIARAQAAETALADAIDSKASQEGLAAETARATAAEAALSDAVAARALQTDLMVEAARAQAAESALSDAVDAEVARAGAAEAVLAAAVASTVSQAALDVEISRATAAEVALSSALSAHEAHVDNPHAVTAEQVDAYAKAAVDAKDAETLDAATAHADAEVTALKSALRSADAGNLLTAGSDDGLNFAFAEAAVDIDDTAPTPVGPSQVLRSTLLDCYMMWNGSSWRQTTPAANDIVFTETTRTEEGLLSAIAKAKRIATMPGTSVAIQLAATNYMLSESSSFSGLDLSHVVVKGAAPILATLVSCDAPVLQSGTTYNVAFKVSGVAGMEIGQPLGTFVSAGSAAYWANYNGLWLITGVDQVNNKVTCTVTVSSGAAIVANASLTGSVIAFPTTLGTRYGVSFTNCEVLGFQDLCIVQMGTLTAGANGLLVSGSRIRIQNIGVIGFAATSAYGVRFAGASDAVVDGLYVSRCTGGIDVDEGSRFLGSDNIVVAACGASGTNGYGITVDGGSRAVLPGTTASISVSYGLYCNAGSNIRVSGNVGYQIGGTTAGATAWNGSFVNGVGYLASIGTTSPTRNAYGNNGSAIYA